MKVPILVIILCVIVVSFVSGCTTNSITENDSVEKEMIVKVETFVIKPGFVQYYGGNYETKRETVKYHYIVSSDAPVDVYIVDSESDYKLLVNGDDFIHYPSCKGIQILKYDRVCTIYSQGGIAIQNSGETAAIVNLNVSYYYFD